MYALDFCIIISGRRDVCVANTKRGSSAIYRQL